MQTHPRDLTALPYNRGFTLIELMIVVAIIGILTSIALAAYQDYIAKAQMTEAMSLAGPAKNAIAEYYTEYGGWPADNTAAGLPPASEITGAYVQLVDVSVTDGHVYADFKGTDVAPALINKRIDLSAVPADGSISWVCRANVEARLLPRICTPF